MSGKLYVVGTPIGNLGDISPRAIETLENADFIAAEDTRVTLKLLNHFGIKKAIIPQPVPKSTYLSLLFGFAKWRNITASVPKVWRGVTFI